MLQRGCCTLCTAILLISFGVILLFLRVWIFDSIVSSMFVLGPNSFILSLWRSPPLQVNADFYFFNWTNPEDIHNSSIKPRFQQLGPYKFKSEIEKVNITWNANNTVTFRMLQTYYFDEEHSIGKLTDQITTLNTVATSAAYAIRNKDYFTKKGFSLSLGLLAPQIHITKSASELLFEGYSDPYLDLVQSLPFLADGAAPVDKAGFLYGKNGSYTSDGVYNVDVGQDTGEIVNWNYQNESFHYEDPCKNLRGSLGDIFNQKLSREYIKFFTPYACRNLKFDYEQDVTVSGVDGYKYSAHHSMLDNGTLIPENKCLCNGDCIPSGMLNMSSCAYGSPSFMSLPHFYGADPVYLSMVEGLQPEKSKHEMFITVQPRIGVCINLALRIQLNFLLQPIEYITLYEQVPKVFFPLLWFEQSASIPTALAWLIIICLNLPNVILPVLAVSLIIVGLSLLVCKCYKSRNRVIKRKPPKREQSALEAAPLRFKKDVDFIISSKLLCDNKYI